MADLTFDFSGRTVLVTGAGQGIGRALAAFFGAAGAHVGAADIDGDVLAAAMEEIPGGVPLICDVSRPGDAAEAVRQLVDETGRLDVLVNNAGILRDGVVWKLTDEMWDAVLGVHLTGTFNMTRAAVPVMREAEYGRIINVTSYSGLHGNFGQANYAAAKAGIIGFTRTTAKELGSFGITVNAISPNARTEMVASIPEPRRERLREQIPLGRFGEPEEMAVAVGFLASEETAYVTGTVVPVDGGLSI